jgi:hypothetical protein
MFEDQDLEKEPRRSRLAKSTRSRTPQAARSTRPKKTTATGFGGSHRRRNKHWSW